MAIRTNQKYTLKDISQRKQKVLQDIRIQHQAIAETAQKIFAPFLPSPNQGRGSLAKKFYTSMAIFDGVMIGIKLFKRIRKIFSA
ncbi:MAG: hypothetical protein LBF17_03115 [Mediterranea sp.]|jgi:hypothetical protein|nr:hypothetical protein [Mediterranea sp.]